MKESFEPNKSSLAKNKYAEYIRDFTALGNPFMLLIIVLVALQRYDFHAIEHMVILVSGFLFNEIFCSGIKYFWHKPRPNQQGFETGFEKIDAGSFPSIHAARVSWVYGYLAVVFYPNWLVGLLFISIILLVGYTRIFLKKHFLTDVIAGYIIGTSLNVFVYFYISPLFF